MIKQNQHIEIVSSTKSRLSSMSRPSRNAIQRVLSRHYKHVGITLVDDLSDLESLVSKSPDLVFLGMKSIDKEPSVAQDKEQKIWLADYLAQRGIATTGSNSMAHHLEINKPLAKESVSGAGLKTSSYRVVRADQVVSERDLPAEYPLFVKPANRGGGVGIDSDSIVYSLAELKAKVNSISERLNSDSLVEAYLPGREFSVAVLKDSRRGDYIAMPLELVAPADERGARILSGKVKSADAEQAIEVTDLSLRQSIEDLAIKVFRSLGGRDYGRIDIRMDERGRPHFLEANLIPSLIDNYGSFPKACALNQGIDYEEMILRIVELGMARTNAYEKKLDHRLAQSAESLHDYAAAEFTERLSTV